MSKILNDGIIDDEIRHIDEEVYAELKDNANYVLNLVRRTISQSEKTSELLDQDIIRHKLEDEGILLLLDLSRAGDEYLTKLRDLVIDHQIKWVETVHLNALNTKLSKQFGLDTEKRSMVLDYKNQNVKKAIVKRLQIEFEKNPKSIPSQLRNIYLTDKFPNTTEQSTIKVSKNRQMINTREMNVFISKLKNKMGVFSCLEMNCNAPFLTFDLLANKLDLISEEFKGILLSYRKLRYVQGLITKSQISWIENTSSENFIEKVNQQPPKTNKLFGDKLIYPTKERILAIFNDYLTQQKRSLSAMDIYGQISPKLLLLRINIPLSAVEYIAKRTYLYLDVVDIRNNFVDGTQQPEIDTGIVKRERKQTSKKIIKTDKTLETMIDKYLLNENQINQIFTLLRTLPSHEERRFPSMELMSDILNVDVYAIQNTLSRQDLSSTFDEELRNAKIKWFSSEMISDDDFVMIFKKEYKLFLHDAQEPYLDSVRERLLKIVKSILSDDPGIQPRALGKKVIPITSLCAFINLDNLFIETDKIPKAFGRNNITKSSTELENKSRRNRSKRKMCKRKE